MASKIQKTAKVVTANEMRLIDKRAIEYYGIPAAVLMENAGRNVAEAVYRLLQGKRSKKVLVFCGRGNNGGDGMVCARYLANKGINTKVFLLGQRADIKNEPLTFMNVLLKMGVPIYELRDSDNIDKRLIKRCDLIIDAIFGTGLSSPVREPIRGIINILNSAGKTTVSVDVPSGLDATKGKALGCCIKAAQTVTFAYAKKGFFINDGPKYSGRIVVTDIGIPNP